MLPAAPTRFSMISCCPHICPSCGPTIRMTTSGEVAAGNGMISRTKRPGYPSCACAAAAQARARTNRIVLDRMGSLPESLLYCELLQPEQRPRVARRVGGDLLDRAAEGAR